MPHEFNNKLTVILGYTQMAKEILNSTDPIYANLRQVMKTGEQSVRHRERIESTYDDQ